jgi:hypothetical protein
MHGKNEKPVQIMVTIDQRREEDNIEMDLRFGVRL